MPLPSLGIQGLIHNSVYSIPTTLNEPDPAGLQFRLLSTNLTPQVYDPAGLINPKLTLSWPATR
jgi:hypothetical protein